MWTVTLLLKPMIVTLHLLGGMTTLALLLTLLLGKRFPPSMQVSGNGSARWPRLALFWSICQIALGGWVSSNYAALRLPGFPTCQGQWQPPMISRRPSPCNANSG